MSARTRKATFNLSPQVLSALNAAMAAGAAPSKNVLVERALVRELKEIERKERQVRWEQGARDAALLKDISDVEIDFASSDAETAGRIDS
jgi:hypothetical protein